MSSSFTELVPPDCPECRHNDHVEPRSTGADGWECFACGSIWTEDKKE